MRAVAIFLVVVVGCLSQASAQSHTWSTTADIPLFTRWPDASGKVHEQSITADLFRPNAPGRLPAAVIINSSGGVMAHTELFYARLLAKHGVAALVVDSFLPRGISRTVEDQTRVWQSQSNADAAAGFRWLASQAWVDTRRIIVLGMSRGAIAAIANAVEAERKYLHATDTLFAAHVAVAPSCGFQSLDARTTGAPILFMLSELDDYTPIAPCLEYYERIRSAGNSKARLAVYPGVYHAQEWIGGMGQEAQAERYGKCRFFRKDDRTYTDRSNGADVSILRMLEHERRTCVDRGPVTVGGDSRVKSQAMADLIQFLRDFEIVDDPETKSLVSACDPYEGVLKQNCLRARAGWTGDLVALARFHRYTKSEKRNPGLAAQMFRLAAARGHPHAQWELGFMQLFGLGLAKDAAAALPLLKASAEAGEAPAMNMLGVAARDGIGQARDDIAAVAWFRNAAELRHEYALANLGRMLAQGRGGLAKDSEGAVRLFRKSAHYNNPWGRLWLAEALEKGDGVATDAKAAFEHFTAVAGQDREPEARARAIEALARLAGPAKK